MGSECRGSVASYPLEKKQLKGKRCGPGDRLEWRRNGWSARRALVDEEQIAISPTHGYSPYLRCAGKCEEEEVGATNASGLECTYVHVKPEVRAPACIRPHALSPPHLGSSALQTVGVMRFASPCELDVESFPEEQPVGSQIQELQTRTDAPQMTLSSREERQCCSLRGYRKRLQGGWKKAQWWRRVKSRRR